VISHRLARAACVGGLALLSSGCSVGVTAHAADLIATGHSRTLTDRPKGSAGSSPDRPGILVLALDGVDRKLIYDMLDAGEMPALATLLGGQDDGAGAPRWKVTKREGGSGGTFPHAFFSDRMLSTLPSSTIAAWVTGFTGEPPAVHGVTGNEFFARESRRFIAPAPVTVHDVRPVIECYTDDYLNKVPAASSVYQKMREQDPNVLVWVAMHQYYAGADRLLLTSRTVMADAVKGFLEKELDEHVKNKTSRKIFEDLDEEVLSVVQGQLDESPLPDVLTVYLSGTDQYAHVADEGPTPARRAYLREVLDPKFRGLFDKLRQRGALTNRYVVITADHGHTQVVKDDLHALGMKGPDDPPEIVRKAGFRLRPFKMEVDEDDDFQAVLAYQGAMAYVYLADRSTCEKKKAKCDWNRPPRFREDVLAMAEAFHRNNEDGSLVPEMKGTLDMVLAREPRPQAEVDRPFQVYVGDGKLQPVEAYLAAHPHPTYVDLAQRLRDLAEGPFGERAGDVLLVAHNGDRDDPAQRYYFSGLYQSWHGSPSRQDSEIPLIVAHPGKRKDEIRTLVDKAIGERPSQQRVTDVLLALRGIEREKNVRGAGR
jgi:hypothetical protein